MNNLNPDQFPIEYIKGSDGTTRAFADPHGDISDRKSATRLMAVVGQTDKYRRMSDQEKWEARIPYGDKLAHSAPTREKAARGLFEKHLKQKDS